MWQCDFFSKHVATAEGVLRQCFVLVFVHVGTRRVWVSPGAYQTDEAWVVRQVESFLDHASASRLPVGLVLRDRGSTFYPAFDRALEAAGAKVQRLAFRSPNTNAYVERFVQAIQRECLDKSSRSAPGTWTT